MSEHAALRDRLERALEAMGPASLHQVEQAQRFIDNLSGSGYTRWLRCACEMREILPHWFHPASQVEEVDFKLWLKLSPETQATLLLAADVINGNQLTNEQRTLLADLQREQETQPDPTLDLHERRLLAELWLAKAQDECRRRQQPPTSQPKPATETEKPPPGLAGTEYEHDRRRWPKGWGL